MSEAALNFSTPDDREELARAEVYGLLASLFYAAPTAELYEQLRVAVTEAPAAGAFLETSWSELVATARRLSLAQVSGDPSDAQARVYVDHVYQCVSLETSREDSGDGPPMPGAGPR